MLYYYLTNGKVKERVSLVMNIKRAKEEIIHTVNAYLMKDETGHFLIPTVRQRPVLLIGPPGIGKTAIMEQVAAECNVGLVSYTMTHHTRQSALGLPFIEKKEFQGKTYSITEYTMSEIIASVYEKIEKTGLEHGILFIDEINCVSETLAPVMLQFLQGKTFGNAKVPEGWVIVAAGNPPEYNRSVREFDVVTLDRVKLINLEPDYPAWKKYAYERNIHGAIRSYLEVKQENFYQIETTVDGLSFVTARGWEDLSNIIYVYEKMNLKVDATVTVQYLQNKKIAVDFANYLELYYKYDENYKIDSILNGEFGTTLVSRIQAAGFDEKISVVGLLLSRLNTEFINVYRYDSMVTEIYGVLKNFQSELQKENTLLPNAIFKKLIEKSKKLYELRKENTIFDKEQEVILYKVNAKLNEISYKLTDNFTNHLDVFEAVKAEFVKLQDTRESMIKEASCLLENAFEFLENTFGEGPEMILFVTELSAGFFSLRFIQENGCQKFFKYNTNLGEGRRNELLAELEELNDL